MTTLALIGAGKWGQNYLRTASTLEGIKIKYVCTQSQQTLDSLHDTYTKTASIKDLLKNKDIEGFIIATPAITHFSIAEQLLSLGHNLLIEKPLTTNLVDSLKLQKIWQVKKPKVLVGHLYLYNPAYHEFKNLFNHIKEIRSISFEGLNSPVRSDISVIWDWGPHPISMLLDLTKQPVTKVAATGSRDTVNATIYFINGIKASIRISWFGSNKVRRLTVEGDNGIIELDDTKFTNKISLCNPSTPIQYPRYQPESSLTKELTEFAEAIQSSKDIASDINMGVSVVRVLSAIEESVENGGQSVKLSSLTA